MNNPGEFYTFKGYQTNTQNEMTPVMEDYLEMICRLLHKSQVVRTKELADMLHVKASSVSKMIQILNSAGYIESEKYGYITVTEKGKMEGEYFLYRHKVLEQFLCTLNQTKDELEQVERIEHFLNKTTVANLSKLTIAMLDHEIEPK